MGSEKSNIRWHRISLHSFYICSYNLHLIIMEKTEKNSKFYTFLHLHIVMLTIKRAKERHMTTSWKVQLYLTLCECVFVRMTVQSGATQNKRTNTHDNDGREEKKS